MGLIRPLSIFVIVSGLTIMASAQALATGSAESPSAAVSEGNQAVPSKSSGELVPLTEGISPAPPVLGRSYSKPMTFAVGIYYDFSNLISTNGTMNIQNHSYSFNGSEGTEGVPGIELSLQHRFNRRWGLEYGAAYEFQRVVNSYSFSANGTTYSGPYNPTDSFTAIIVQVDARFFATDDFYVLAGGGVSKVNVSNSNVVLNPALGLEAGVGYELLDHFGFEAQYRLRTATGSESDVINGNNVNISYTYTFDGVMVLTRYIF